MLLSVVLLEPLELTQTPQLPSSVLPFVLHPVRPPEHPQTVKPTLREIPFVPATFQRHCLGSRGRLEEIRYLVPSGNLRTPIPWKRPSLNWPPYRSLSDSCRWPKPSGRPSWFQPPTYTDPFSNR